MYEYAPPFEEDDETLAPEKSTHVSTKPFMNSRLTTELRAFVRKHPRFQEKTGPFQPTGERPFHGMRIQNPGERMGELYKYVCILAPDEASGLDFYKTVLKELTFNKSELTPEYRFISKIPPRVSYNEDGIATLEENRKEVIASMAFAMIEAIQKGNRLFVWACNTISIGPYLNKAFQAVQEISAAIQSGTIVLPGEIIIDPILIPEGGYHIGIDYLVVDTLDTLKNNYESKNKKRGFFIGTDIMVGEVEAYDFESTATQIRALTRGPEDPPLSKQENQRLEKYKKLQRVTQEVIWRVKAANKADVSGAKDKRKDAPTPYRYPHFGHISEMDEQTQKINASMLLTATKEMFLLLRDLGHDEVILGCTELPIALNLAFRHEIMPRNWGPSFIDPAEAVGDILYEIEKPDPLTHVPEQDAVDLSYTGPSYTTPFSNTGKTSPFVPSKETEKLK